MEYQKSDGDVICKQEIIKNIALVEQGKPLTLPLATLNKNCGFDKIYAKTYEDEIITEKKVEKKEYNRKYNSNPETKRKVKEYNDRPEIKQRMNKYRMEWQRKKNNTPKSKWRVK